MPALASILPRHAGLRVSDPFPTLDLIIRYPGHHEPHTLILFMLVIGGRLCQILQGSSYAAHTSYSVLPSYQ